MYLPEEFEQKMKNMLGEDFDTYKSSFDVQHKQGLRVNTSKISVEDFLALTDFTLEPVPWCNNGFYYNKEDQPTKHPHYYAGLYYIQEPSAMAPASFMPIEPGDRVLDICAAPGGKSTELATKLNGEGILVSNDISHTRAKALLKNLEIFGIGNAIVLSETPKVLASRFSGYFDKILIDAPCSGEGMFRKQSSMIKAWEKSGVEPFIEMQHSILDEVVKMLKPGGKILYSTCTFSPEENEQSIEYLMSLDSSIHLMELPMYDGFDQGHIEWSNTQNTELTRTRRLWPHRIKGEGHFVALATKDDQDTRGDYIPYRVKKNKITTDFYDFIKNITIEFSESRFEISEDRIYYIPEDLADIKGIRLLRTGLYMGEMKKNRFEPSQALAMFLKGDEYKNTINLSSTDPNVIRYLKGETIELEEDGPNGMVLILVDGYPLGWGKNNRGTIKNKYLPSWRLLS